ncbi:phosphoglycerate kinase [Candidatus Fermentibacteria bacterium]|nr:phosphoglycerate kinase [Candidatus Fermentibacteria bacterium]
MQRMTVRDVDLAGTRVIARVDYNVPLDSEGRVTDDLRIRETLPTVRYVLGHGASLVLMAHLGRPKGKIVPGLSLRPVANRLSELLKIPVAMAPDCVGPETAVLAAGLKPGGILLLENLRFHKEEESNDPDFARQLATFGDVYVNDAFGTAHRAHASTEGITHHLSTSVAGFLMERELAAFHALLSAPQRPFLAILGGAKVSDKIGVLQNLLRVADSVFVGGAMANTFLLAKGFRVGDSLVETAAVDTARAVMEDASRMGKEVLLPVDVVVATELSRGAVTRVVPGDGIPDGWKALDIGPLSIQAVRDSCAHAATIFWNGPMGVFETPPFDAGTMETARALASATSAGVVTVVGGGDSGAALQKAGLAAAVTHLSTGGGASLELVEGRELPGVMALQAVQA